MKKKNTTKQYWYNFFTAKPKSNFWMWAFITLFIFRWVTPNAIMLMIPLQIGLMSPSTHVDYDNISINVANNIVKPMETMNKLGSNISNNNKYLGLFFSQVIGYFTYVIWIAMFFLIINLCRYGISYLYRKYARKHK